MDIKVLAPETLECYKGLPLRLTKWASLANIDKNDLEITIFCGSLLEVELGALIWTFDPRDLTKGIPNMIGKFKPPNIIHIDMNLDRPRWGKLALYFFHEIGHYLDYMTMGKGGVTEESAERYALKMLREYSQQIR